MSTTLYHSDLYVSLFSMLFSFLFPVPTLQNVFVSILKRVSAQHTKFTWSDCLLGDFDEGHITG